MIVGKVVRSIFLFDDEISHQSESVAISPLLQSPLILIKLTKLREFVFERITYSDFVWKIITRLMT